MRARKAAAASAPGAGKSRRASASRGASSRRPRKASPTLPDSEERYRELIANLPNGILVYQDGRLVFANEFILGISQCPLDKLDDRKLIDLIHPEDRQTAARNLALRQAGKAAPDAYEIRATTKDGGWSYFVIQPMKIRFKGKPATMYVLTDISEKRRSERIQDAVYRISEAVHSAVDLPALFRSIHEIISALMTAGNFYIALFDPKSGMLSFPYFVDEFDPPPVTRGLENGLTEYVLRSGQPLLATPEILADLERRNEIELIGAPSIDWLGVPLKIGGKTIGVLVVQTYSPGLRYGEEEKNILMFVSNQVAMAIERKRAEASLRRSEQRNRAVLQAIPDLMFLLDRQGVFLDYKAERESDLIVSPEAFLGKKVDDVLPPWLAELTMRHIALALQTRSLQVFEYEVEMHGRLRYEEARCVLCGNDEVLVVIRDITENRHLERQVLQAQKMESLGTLAGGIAHDFNNILAGILGYASFMKSRLDAGHDFFKYIDTIERSANRAADLTSKLLSFTRGDKVNFKPLDVNRLVGETLEIIRHTFDKSIRIDSQIDARLPTIEGDPSQVQQVVMNLCVNARDAMLGGGTLAVATAVTVFEAGNPKLPPGARPGPYVNFSVSDSGSGMSREILSRIFDPFFTTKSKGHGSGLGLSVVYGIVKRHEGFVTVDSQLGQGTEFHVYFPASGRPEAREGPLAEAPRGSGELVFVVDDEEDIRHLLADVLTDYGYRVLMAADGLRALALYREHFPDIALVILDMVMPGMGGEELFLRLREINPAVRAVLSTGFSDEGRAAEFLARGVSGFIQKPYDVHHLLVKLRAVLAQPGHGGEAAPPS